MCPKIKFWWFWWWRSENTAFWPPKGTTPREYASVDVSRVKIGSTAWALGLWKDFCVRRNKKNNSVVTLAIWLYIGRSNPCGDLDQMWHVVDVITCAIFGDCRLRGVGVVRGVILPYSIDLRYRPYNTGTVWPCDSSNLRLLLPTGLSSWLWDWTGLDLSCSSFYF